MEKPDRLNWLERVRFYVGRVDEYCKNHGPVVGRLCAFGNASLLSLHIIIVRLYSRTLDPLKIVHDEMVWSILFATIAGYIIDSREFYPKEPRLSNILLMRSCFSFPSFISAVLGQYFLPSQVFVVLSNSQVIFSILFAIKMMDQYPKPSVVFFVAMFIFGVVMMMCPGLLGLSVESLPYFNPIYLIFPMVTGVCGGMITNILMKHRAALTVLQNSVWSSSAVSLASGLGLCLRQQRSPFTLFETMVTPVLGLCMFTSQVFIFMACRYEPKPGIVATIVSSNILITFVLDKLLLRSDVPLTNLIGAIIVFVSVVSIALLKTK